VHAPIEDRDLGGADLGAWVQEGGEDPPAADGDAVGVGEAVLPGEASAAVDALQQGKTCTSGWEIRFWKLLATTSWGPRGGRG